MDTDNNNHRLVEILTRNERHEDITNVALLDYRIIKDAKEGSMHKGHIEFDIGIEYERDGFTKFKGIECLLEQRTHNLLDENDFLYRLVMETDVEEVSKSKKEIMAIHPEEKEEDIMIGSWDLYKESIRFTIKKEIRDLEKEAGTSMYRKSNIPKESVCYLSFLKDERYYLCDSPGGSLWSQYKIDFTDTSDITFAHVKDYIINAGEVFNYDKEYNMLKKNNTPEELPSSYKWKLLFLDIAKSFY